MATFITNAELTTFVAGALKQNVAEPNATDYWADIISAANQGATDEIRGRLSARGFTSTQIDEWDRRVEFNKYVGLYFSIVHGGLGGSAYDDRYLERLKMAWLDQLETVAVLNNGTLQTDKAINFGPVSTADDLFVMPTDDPRIGEETSW